MTDDEERVASIVRDAFQGVVLGEGVGLWQAQGIDEYADAETLARFRARDEKLDWSAISNADLDRCQSSLSFVDAEGMRFLLPAYLISELQRSVPVIIFRLMGSKLFVKLNDLQRNAVREYLLLRLTSPYNGWEMIESALDEYWARDVDWVTQWLNANAHVKAESTPQRY